LPVAAAIAVVGIILGLVLLCWSPNDQYPAVRSQTGNELLNAQQARTGATVALEGAKATARAAEVDADLALSRAVSARARARIVSGSGLIVSESPDVTPTQIRVPPSVIDRLTLDSTAVSALGTLVRWKDTLIFRQDQRITADSVELLATWHALTALQRVKEPRCGRKCGIVLGVGGMLAAAVVVEQVRRTFR
jgi:hypothetical protein